MKANFGPLLLVSKSLQISFRRSFRCKVLFFGTDEFSVPTLAALHDSENVHVEACCAEMKKLVPLVRQFSDRHNITVHKWPPDVSKCKEFDLGVIASFGHLVPKKIIEAFPRGILNVHGSLLPKWRGAAPIAHAIMNGDKETGITIMKVQPHHFDLGQMLAAQKCDIGPDETRQELSEKMSHIGADLMLKVLQDLDSYSEHARSQGDQGVSYAPRLTKSSFEVKWDQCSSWDVYNQYRALAGLSKLYSVWQDTGRTVRFANIVHPHVVRELATAENDDDDVLPGRTVSIKANGQRYIAIKCNKGWVSFEQFYYGSRKVMSASDFFNGFMSKFRQRPLYFVRSKDDENHHHHHH